MRILITGADGFAGPYVAEALVARGHKIAAMTRGAAKFEHSAYASWHVADLIDMTAVRSALAEAQPDAVIHLAAISFVGHADVQELYTSNVVGHPQSA
jgi:nucleoside-diphosphate-sugar epimerase